MLDTINIIGKFGEWQGMGLGMGFLEYQGIPFNGQTSFTLHRTRAYYSRSQKFGIVTFLTELNASDAFYHLAGTTAESLNSCSVTSSIENSLSASVNIAPNPGNDIVRISITDDSNSIFQFRLYNSLGQLIKTISGISDSYVLNKQEIGSGHFFIQIVPQHKKSVSVVKKFILN